jgi:hypothetical protein
LAPALAIAAIAVFASAGGYAIANSTDSGTTAHCETGVNVPHIRWHYAGSKNGTFTSGSWSATGTPQCPSGQITMTQGPMEGDLQLGQGDTIKGGYSFTVPGGHPQLQVTLFNPQIQFFYQCHSGTALFGTTNGQHGTFTLKLNGTTQTIPANNSDWFPTGNQSIAYYGSLVLPQLCSDGSKAHFDAGAASFFGQPGPVFTATILVQ